MEIRLIDGHGHACTPLSTRTALQALRPQGDRAQMHKRTQSQCGLLANQLQEIGACHGWSQPAIECEAGNVVKQQRP
eukprot:6480289-Amphidinium_carterae.1